MADDIQDLPGRHIDDGHYSGLVESLIAITILCSTARDSTRQLSRDELMALLSVIDDKALRSLAYSGATPDEVKAMSEHVVRGLHDRSN